MAKSSIKTEHHRRGNEIGGEHLLQMRQIKMIIKITLYSERNVPFSIV